MLCPTMEPLSCSNRVDVAIYLTTSLRTREVLELVAILALKVIDTRGPGVRLKRFSAKITARYARISSTRRHRRMKITLHLLLVPWTMLMGRVVTMPRIKMLMHCCNLSPHLIPRLTCKEAVPTNSLHLWFSSQEPPNLPYTMHMRTCPSTIKAIIRVTQRWTSIRIMAQSMCTRLAPLWSQLSLLLGLVLASLSEIPLQKIVQKL